MKIGNIQLGFGIEVPNAISLNVYLSGCKNNKQCNMAQCHNQHLRNFNYGVDYTEVLPTIKQLCNSELIDCVVLLGGEPLDANEESLKTLIQFIRNNCKVLPIYIYTGYTYTQIISSITKLFEYGIDGICYGPYDGHSIKQWVYKS